MTEEVRDVSVTIRVDTNKQSYESTFNSLPSALAWFDQSVPLEMAPLLGLDLDRLRQDVEKAVCAQRPGGASVEDDYVDNSLTGTVKAVLNAIRTQLVEKEV